MAGKAKRAVILITSNRDRLLLIGNQSMLEEGASQSSATELATKSNNSLEGSFLLHLPDSN